MLIDFERGFNSLSLTFLYKTLSFFNFSQNFIHWIKTLNCSTIKTQSTSFIKQIETLFYGFIWDDKPDKIKRATLTQNYTNSRLKMMDFQNFLRGLQLTWIRRILIHPYSQWNNVLN